MIKIQENVELTPYLTMREKGIARYFCVAKSAEELLEAVNFAQEKKLPFFVLGGGSNVILGSELYPGLIIKNEYQKFKIKNFKLKIEISVSSGYPMSKLVNETVKNGWSGLEYFAGLPGTVGGAVIGNAHWTKPLVHIKDLVKKINIKNSIIFDITLQLKKENPKILEQRAKEVIEYRKTTQPTGFSSGCIFQNLSDYVSTGKLIDQAGLKGLRSGAFYVSDKHANFIMSDGSGNPSDLLTLIGIIKQRIKEKYALELKEEVILLL